MGLVVRQGSYYLTQQYLYKALAIYIYFMMLDNNYFRYHLIFNYFNQSITVLSIN